MKIKSMPELERPVEKCLANGIESLSNDELLALLINTGTKEKSAKDLAAEVLAKDRAGLMYLRESSVDELMTVNGIGAAKAARIMAAVELGKRLSARPVQKGMTIENDEDIAELFMEEMRRLKKETFKALLLSSKGGVISVETISVGELNSTLVHPREVFSAAVKKSAAAIVFIHNHPSGDPTPSRSDRELTENVAKVGTQMDIPLLDHIIIGDNRYTSFREQKFLI